VFSAIVFDFDGTLVDTNAIKREGFFHIASGCAENSMSMKSVLASVSGDRRTILGAYAKQVMVQPGEPAQQIVDDLVAAYNTMVDAAVVSAPEMPGATGLLEALRCRGRKLYLSSATPLENLQGIVAKRNWTDRFDGIFGGPTIKADVLRHVMSVTGLCSNAIAVIGDGEDDRFSAMSVGCTFFPVGEARGTQAHEKIYTLPELITVLFGAKESP